MTQHYIKRIEVNEVYHLKNIIIDLGEEKKHLILTGRNGSGKTSLLRAIRENLRSVYNGERSLVPDNPEIFPPGHILINGVFIDFQNETELEDCFFKGDFIVAYFPADRMTTIDKPHGVEDVKLQDSYTIDVDPVQNLLKYMVHLKTQEAYAKNADDEGRAARIKKWFSEFTNALCRLLDDDTIDLEYDYRNYNFLIKQDGRNPYDFNQLSDGFSAALRIMADLMMRMDGNWLMKDTEIVRTAEGVVLIDEIETHLHLELQRTILPFLTEMFPNLQFIVSTHSPFIVNSLENAVIYDLERKIRAGDGLSNVTYEGVVEGYFRADTLSERLREKFNRYKKLVKKQRLNDDEYEEIMELELYLEEIPDFLSIGIAAEYQKLKLEFRNREEH